MFAKPTILVGSLQRVVATLVACSVVAASIGMYARTAQAASLTFISDTLSTSNPGVTSAHTLAFTIPAGSALTNSDTVTITFPAGFTGVNTVVTGDISVTASGTPDAHANFAAGTSTISFNSVAATAGQEVIVAIANGKITNPGSTGSYRIGVNTGATTTDSGNTEVAVVDTVLVTAVVETTFTFTVNGTATTTSVNGNNTTGSTTATQIPFGTLTADTSELLAQQLTVATNAIHGFSVTVETDGNLQSANGAIIDNFVEGSDVAVAGTPWAAPVTDINDATTWGHWGMTSDDTDLANNLDAAASYIAASTTPREIFSHNGPSDATTQDIGKAIVGYQIEISALQEAADDYQTTLTYIATPTF